MTFSVSRSSRAIVRPSGSTPLETLDLSVIDKLPALRCNARTLHVFKHGIEAAKKIKEALSKALVPYYPLAGRLKESDHGELQIACTGEGVWFVEASANCGLDTVNNFDNVMMVPYDDLLPDAPPKTEAIEPLVLMQVTTFTCEGFVIGLVFCHSICDGLGAAQFLTAVGELAQGLEHPNIKPVWYRDVLTNGKQLKCNTFAPPPPPPPPMPLMPNHQLEHASVDISLERVDKLKHEFSSLTGKKCSTFEVIAASIWSSRTRAINLEKNTKVRLVFFANTRQFSNPALPKGFYGNCFFPVTVTVASEEIFEASNTEVVKLIQEAKAKLGYEFTKWIRNEDVKEGQDPFAPPLNYTTLFISEWGRLGFNQVNYGWGPPIHVVPIQGSGIIPVGIVGLPPTPKKGIRLMTWCVEATNLPSLLDQMNTKLA